MRGLVVEGGRKDMKKVGYPKNSYFLPD